MRYVRGDERYKAMTWPGYSGNGVELSPLIAHH